MAEANAYDGQLANYYSKSSFESPDFINRTATLQISGAGEKGIPFRHILSPSFESGLSLTSKEAEGVDGRLGLFFVNEIVPEFSPFSDVFSGWDQKPSALMVGELGFLSGPTRGNNAARLLNELNCSVIELYDALFAFEDLNRLAEIKTLEILGLPARGVVFEGKFSFPENLKILVVRNCELNDSFFNALSDLPDLSQLVLLNCTTTLEYPLTIEFGHDRERSWIDRRKVFEVGAQSISCLTIRDSHPVIFSYMIPETWRSLEKLEVDIMAGNMPAARTLLLSSESFRLTFPELERLSLRVTIPEIDEVRQGARRALKNGEDIDLVVEEYK